MEFDDEQSEEKKATRTYPEIRIPENPGNPDFRNSDFSEIRIFGNLDFRIPGNPDFWISGIKSGYPKIPPKINQNPGVPDLRTVTPSMGNPLTGSKWEIPLPDHR